MRENFREYHPPTETELRQLWARGTIVLDTNVLLNLYRYPIAAREDMIAVLQNVRDRLWIPHHVALEYYRNRETVIESQLEVFEKVKRILGFARLESQLDALQLRRRHSLISTDAVMNDIKPILDKFESELAELEDKHVKPTGHDPVRDTLETLLAGKIGSAPSSLDVEAIIRDGEKRYRLGVPPGHADEKEKKQQKEYVHGGVTYHPMYGDLILWKQLLRYAAEQKVTHVMFVSDDEKTDWRVTSTYRGHRESRPRPELAEEIRREAGVEVFAVYSSDSFLNLAKKILGVTIADATIPQVSDVNAATRLDTDARMLDEHLGLVNIVTEEGNRRDALLACGFCRQSDIPMYFYEGDGVPRLSEVLGFFHYWRCPAYVKGTPVHLMILGVDRDPQLFTWTPLPHQKL